MGFVWVTDVSVDADIDAADRNETRTNIAWLYTQVGANWPGNVRFPGCGGAGFDVAAPCPVVWPIAVDDSIYQTPGAHPVSELQEARDKLDWIDDNKCATENAVVDSTVHGAANPTTQGAANPTTRAAANPNTRAVANPVTQAVAYPITQAAENPVTQAVAYPITQAGENPVTNISFEPGCDSDCPDENAAANPTTNTGDDDTAFFENYQDFAGNKTIDLDLNQSGDYFEDYGTVEHSDRQSVQSDDDTPYNVIVNIGVFLGVHSPDYAIDNTHYCSSEFATVKTHVDYDDIT